MQHIRIRTFLMLQMPLGMYTVISSFVTTEPEVPYEVHVSASTRVGPGPAISTMFFTREGGKYTRFNSCLIVMGPWTLYRLSGCYCSPSYTYVIISVWPLCFSLHAMALHAQLHLTVSVTSLSHEQVTQVSSCLGMGWHLLKPRDFPCMWYCWNQFMMDPEVEILLS